MALLPDLGEIDVEELNSRLRGGRDGVEDRSIQARGFRNNDSKWIRAKSVGDHGRGLETRP